MLNYLVSAVSAADWYEVLAEEIVEAETERRVWRPEECLWAEVLADGLAALRSRHADHRVDATAWVSSDDTHIGSFVFVCDVLRIDPSYLRARLPLYVAAPRLNPNAGDRRHIRLFTGKARGDCKQSHEREDRRRWKTSSDNGRKSSRASMSACWPASA